MDGHLEPWNQQATKEKATPEQTSQENEGADA
jgi:hypothetical protein